MSALAIDAHDLVKTFGALKAVDGVSISVKTGQIFGFLGPNGSGKTTTIRMLCGLLTPDSGGGTCLGLDLVKDATRIKQQVGYMTQRFSMYEDLTVRENLDFVARIYGREHEGRVRDVCERFGLTRRQDQLAGTLSGGWKQRLALAAAILPEPKLLLLDEPTAGVDPQARREFWDHIHYLALDGVTVLVSTHYMDEAERCHEIAYMSYGHLIARGSVREVIQQSGLIVYSVTGPDLPDLAEGLKHRDGIEMVAPFGMALRVGGRQSSLIEKALKAAQTNPGQFWRKDSANLEDVFIQKMAPEPNGGTAASADGARDREGGE